MLETQYRAHESKCAAARWVKPRSPCRRSSGGHVRACIAWLCPLSSCDAPLAGRSLPAPQPSLSPGLIAVFQIDRGRQRAVYSTRRQHATWADVGRARCAGIRPRPRSPCKRSSGRHVRTCVGFLCLLRCPPSPDAASLRAAARAKEQHRRTGCYGEALPASTANTHTPPLT